MGVAKRQMPEVRSEDWESGDFGGIAGGGELWTDYLEIFECGAGVGFWFDRVLGGVQSSGFGGGVGGDGGAVSAGGV